MINFSWPECIITSLILRGLHAIARNTANLNRLHQPKGRSNED